MPLSARILFFLLIFPTLIPVGGAGSDACLEAGLNMAGGPAREGESYLIQSDSKNCADAPIDITLGPCGPAPHWLIGVVGPDGQLWALRNHGSAYSPRSPCTANSSTQRILPGGVATYALNWNMTFATCDPACTYQNATAGTYQLATQTSSCVPCTRADIVIYPANAHFESTLVIIARTWIWNNLTQDIVNTHAVSPLQLDLGPKCATGTYQTHASPNEKLGSQGGAEAYLFEPTSPELPDVIVYQNYRAGSFPQHLATRSDSLLRVLQGSATRLELPSAHGGTLGAIRVLNGTPYLGDAPILPNATVDIESHENITIPQGHYELTQRIQLANLGRIPVHLQPSGGPCAILGGG